MTKTKQQLEEENAQLKERLAQLTLSEDLAQRLKVAQATLILDECNEGGLVADGKFGEQTLIAIEEHLNIT